MIEQRSVDIETIDPHTAIVYFVPLVDRIEILVGVSDPSGHGANKNTFYIWRNSADVSAKDMTIVARRFWREVRDQSSEDYFADGKQLYQWLISPIEPLLDIRSKRPETTIDTLVFVPDGALRSIPLCALADHDGKFLCEKYAIAVSPGLRLTQPRADERVTTLYSANTRLLISGLSVGTQGYPALPNVNAEIGRISGEFPEHSVTLLNDKFITRNVNSALQDVDYSIVHIASHGQFGGDSNETYILTFDARIDLDDLERLIEPSKFRDHPIDLLTLSACETAKGDDKAALGLAGIALKAGALSAVATLWSVNDQSTSILVPTFYERLCEPGITKAKALRTAQMKLMSNPKYRHPYYWSPYLLVGNWL
jgi:CHAT domain-containing protein